MAWITCSWCDGSGQNIRPCDTSFSNTEIVVNYWIEECRPCNGEGFALNMKGERINEINYDALY